VVGNHKGAGVREQGKRWLHARLVHIVLVDVAAGAEAVVRANGDTEEDQVVLREGTTMGILVNSLASTPLEWTVSRETRGGWAVHKVTWMRCFFNSGAEAVVAFVRSSK
jgi:hypothetical protein